MGKGFATGNYRGKSQTKGGLVKAPKSVLALLMTAIFAVPVPATTAGNVAARTRKSASRYRGVPTFADCSSADLSTFDDPVVRQAAVEALGRYNGSVVAVDPNTGRILTVVNQK